MAVVSKRIAIVTDENGDFSATIRGECVLVGVRLTLGTLDEPDITLTSEPDGTAILELEGVTEDGIWWPMAVASDVDGTPLAAYAPFAILDRMEVTVANGGDTFTGELKLLYER